MTAEALLARLDGVRRTGRGWTARCPAHDDSTPSLSIHEGEQGVLLKCWAGCTYHNILAALGVGPSAGFYDAGTRQAWTPSTATAPKRRRYEWRRFADAVYLKAMDHRLHGEAVLSAARDVDIRNWTDADLEKAWEAVGHAYRSLEEADRLDTLGVFLCAQGLEQEAHANERCG